MALLAGAFLLSLQLDWGEKMPQITQPQITRILRQLLPQRTWTKVALWDWLHDTQLTQRGRKQAHATRRQVILIIAADQRCCT